MSTADITDEEIYALLDQAQYDREHSITEDDDDDDLKPDYGGGGGRGKLYGIGFIGEDIPESLRKFI